MSDKSDEVSIPELDDGGISIDDSFDDQAATLLELEADLTSMEGAAIDWDHTYESGIVIGAERVVDSDVPESYPVTTTPVYALRLDIQLEMDRITKVYLDWPDRLTEDAHLIRFLQSRDLSPHSFADILGHEIPLERNSGHYVAQIPDDVDGTKSYTRYLRYLVGLWTLTWAVEKTTPHAHYLVGLCTLFWTVFWLAVSTPVSDTAAFSAFVVTILFPIATYVDAKHVQVDSTWTPRKWVWTVLSFIWVLNIPVGVMYLYKRHKAEFSDS